MADTVTVPRYAGVERLVHAVHLVSCLLLYITGLGLYTKHLFFLVNIFGGVDSARTLHHFGGLVFFGTSLVIGCLMWKEGLWIKADWDWVKVFGGYLKRGAHPPASGKINAGQKMFFYATILCGIALGVTGLELWFAYLFPPLVSQLSVVVHDLSMLGLGIFLTVHIYLSTIGAPGSFPAMVNGTVTRAWAKTHHGLWAKEVMEKREKS